MALLNDRNSIGRLQAGARRSQEKPGEEILASQVVLQAAAAAALKSVAHFPCLGRVCLGSDITASRIFFCGTTKHICNTTDISQ